MNIAFSAGNSSEKIVNSIKSSADNMDFFIYSNIGDMIKASRLRHITFDRIVFTAGILSKEDPEGDLRSLQEYISENSSATEVVLLARKNTPTTFVDMFNKFFVSPLYTPTLLDSITPRSILDLVKEPIDVVRKMHYSSDSEDMNVLTSASTKAESTPIKSDIKKVPEKKKGIFGRLFGGGKETSAENKEVSQNPQNTESVGSDVSDNALNTDSSFSAGPGSQSAISNVNQIENNTNSNSDGIENSESYKNVTSSGGVGSLNGNNLDNDTEEDFLSIGGFGSQHSDTGYLDESDEEELKRELEGSNSTPDVYEEPDDVIKEKEGFVPRQEEVSVAEQVLQPKETKVVKPIKQSLKKLSVDIVVSTGGSYATQKIVDEAVSLVEKEGIKVLIVDLNSSNCLLSYIDMDAFYASEMKYNDFKVYQEDGVDILSTGYGGILVSDDIDILLSDGFLLSYDIVFIDCSANNLGLFTEESIQRCNIVIMSNGEKEDLIAISYMLTDREVVSLFKERYIMSTCLVDLNDNYEYVQEVKGICLFANGCWLDRVDAE